LAPLHPRDDIAVASHGGRLWRAARTLAKDGTVPPGVDDPVLRCDFLAEAKIAWRDRYEMQLRAAARSLQQAAE
jgi:hypothetical protein